MKKTNLFAALAFALAFSGAASAADSSTLNVNASVAGNCKITATAPVNFGALDPASSVDVNANGSVSFWCTKNSAYTLTFNNGANADGTQRRMKGPGAADFIAYGLTPASTTGSGLGKSTPIDVTVAGVVAATAFADASEGAYTDAVTVNITP